MPWCWKLLAPVLLATLVMSAAGIDTGADKVLTFTRFSARLGANLNQFLFCMSYAERKRYDRVVFPRIGASIEQVSGTALSDASRTSRVLWHVRAMISRPTLSGQPQLCGHRT
jgi:hypothetical protein